MTLILLLDQDGGEVYYAYLRLAPEAISENLARQVTQLGLASGRISCLALKAALQQQALLMDQQAVEEEADYKGTLLDLTRRTSILKSGSVAFTFMID